MRSGAARGKAARNRGGHALAVLKHAACAGHTMRSPNKTPLTSGTAACGQRAEVARNRVADDRMRRILPPGTSTSAIPPTLKSEISPTRCSVGAPPRAQNAIAAAPTAMPATATPARVLLLISIWIWE